MARQKPAAKPFLRGSIVDGKTVRVALSFFGCLVIMAVLNLILTASFVAMSLAWLRILFCIAQLAVYYLIAFHSGQSRGTAAVALGETAWNREQAGREIPAEERRACWHPLKGLTAALIGSLPFLALAVINALVAVRQVYTPGSLPEWVSGMASRPDVLEPLTVYSQTVPAEAADFVRMGVRAMIMPFVAITGSDNFGAHLVLDHLSPLLVLLPALFFGAGYLLGPALRAKVHASIDEGEKRRKRREARERRRRQQTRREPTRLN